MRLNTIIERISSSYHHSTEYNDIRKHCSYFLKESTRLPLLKNLSIKYKDIQRVKVRIKDKTDDFIETFNEALSDINKLRQRAVFANGEKTFEDLYEDNKEPFYIFPINGYKFLYSNEVIDSGVIYQNTFDIIVEQNHDIETMTRVLKYNYTDKNLREGIVSGSEIMFYGIPYYYAVRKSSVVSYDTIIEDN